RQLDEYHFFRSGFAPGCCLWPDPDRGLAAPLFAATTAPRGRVALWPHWLGAAYFCRSSPVAAAGDGSHPEPARRQYVSRFRLAGHPAGRLDDPPAGYLADLPA